MDMYLSLSLQPQFLRTTFKPVRQVLMGRGAWLEWDRGSITQSSVESNSPQIAPNTVQLATSVTNQADVQPKRRRLLLGGQALLTVTRPAWKRVASSRVFQAILTSIIILSVIGVTILAVPSLYYRFFPAGTLVLSPSSDGTPLGGSFNGSTAGEPEVSPSPTPSPTPNLPPQDPTLPTGTWLIIPRIGVRTEPKPTLVEEEALAEGVWLVPDFGRPGDLEDLPIIMAAHRYGWQWWWKTDYWKYHSFYNLPETEPGDLIEIIDDQRKYTYEIYAAEEGEEITDYEADLILYTCKFLNSPIRHFRYARLVDWNKNTQS